MLSTLIPLDSIEHKTDDERHVMIHTQKCGLSTYFTKAEEENASHIQTESYKLKTNDERSEIAKELFSQNEVELEVIAEIQETLKITLSELITGNEYKQAFKMKSGINNFSFNISLSNPQLWWPYGHGDQTLHHFFLTAKTHDQLEQRERKIGKYAAKIPKYLD